MQGELTPPAHLPIHLEFQFTLNFGAMMHSQVELFTVSIRITMNILVWTVPSASSGTLPLTNFRYLNRTSPASCLLERP
jgi:hypothetical protein